MKYLALIPIVLVASCASRPQVVLRPTPPPPVEPIEAVRYGEVVRAYHVGRYVDPNQPEAMHEQHPVYRVEVSARWNQRPGPLNAVSLLNPPPDVAFSPPPTNDVLIAEMNRQREATTRVMLEAANLAHSYAELQAVLGEIRNVVRNNAFLDARLATNEQQFIEIRRELEKLSTLPPPSLPTNAVPAPVPETPDTPTP